MRIELVGVSKGRAERALPETSLAYGTGAASLAIAETEQRPTVLGLLASGRMRPDTGAVTIDGTKDAAALRRRVALVDAIGVSEPEANVTVAGVVAEELMFAGYAPNPFAARRWLDGQGLGSLASTPIGNIPPSARIRILLELAALRRGVEGIVLTSPDRHGGEPGVWWELARKFADRGYAVLVIAGRASQTALGTEAPTDEPPVDPGAQGDGDGAPSGTGPDPALEPTTDPSPAHAVTRAEAAPFRTPEPPLEPRLEPAAVPEPDPAPAPERAPDPAAPEREPDPAPAPERQPDPAADPEPETEPDHARGGAEGPDGAADSEPGPAGRIAVQHPDGRDDEGDPK